MVLLPSKIQTKNRHVNDEACANSKIRRVSVNSAHGRLCYNTNSIELVLYRDSENVSIVKKALKVLE
jgi:hypothetical protein